MSLHYLLDGYNVIHQMPDLNRPALEDQRRALVHFLETRRPQGSSRNRVTIVFDGNANVGSSGYAAQPGLFFPPIRPLQ